MHSGYDHYKDGEWVERVDYVNYVGDCEEELLGTPAAEVPFETRW